MKMTVDELRQVLAAHSRWLETDGKEGQRAYLNGANLTRAYLTGADLTGADLTRADLTGAYLSEADLTGADLTRANLTRANLTRAYLNGANLSWANLGGANLTGAYLTRAYLSEANLNGANLSWANLGGAYLTRAIGAISLGSPDGWTAVAWQYQGGVWLRVGCQTMSLAEGRAYWAGKENRREVLAALDYAEAVARLRGWIGGDE